MDKYRLIYNRELSVELLDAYAESLADLRPEILDKAMQRALERCRYLPAPAEIREAYEIIDEESCPSSFPARDCPDCKGTGYQVRKTRDGRVAVVCHCVDPEVKERIENGVKGTPPEKDWSLNASRYYNARKFAAEHRQTFLSDEDAKRLPPIEDQNSYKAEDCPEGREFLAQLKKWKLGDTPKPKPIWEGKKWVRGQGWVDKDDPKPAFPDVKVEPVKPVPSPIPEKSPYEPPIATAGHSRSRP